MIELFKSKKLEEAGFPVHGFTKRKGGVSQGPFTALNLAYDVGDNREHVDENLRLLKRVFQTDAPLHRVKQVHGAKIADADTLLGQSSWLGAPSFEADGIVARGDQGVVAVQNADCAPVLIGDPRTRIVSAVHAGWRGACRGVIRAGVRAMVGKGAAALELVAAIGPCVCHSCYEVGGEVARHFPESVDPIPGKADKFHLDLRSAVEVSLIASGLSGRNIECIDACSACLKKELYSRRRDGEPTGRFLGLISGASRS